jgi:pectate lyase
VSCAALLLALAGCGQPPLLGPQDPPPGSPAASDPIVAQVVVRPQSVALSVKDTVDFTATALDGSGDPIAGASISWSVSDTSVASVSHGKAKGKATGTATITASSGGKKGHSKVKVKSGSGTVALTLTPQADTLDVGKTLRISAEVTDGSGQPVSDATVTWSSSAPGVATVDGGGLVTGVGVGSATITAQTGDVSADALVTVEDPTADPPPPPASSSGTLAAFPGAEGYGATALGQCDRSSVQVLRVTNLQDSGAGSLRDAIGRVDNNRLSIIVFTEAGYIHLSDEIRLQSTGCLYIAGQTAPGGGITIQRAPGKGLFLRYDTHDIVIRYLRFRGGYAGDYKGHVNILVGSGQNIIMDHLSLGWTTDKLLIIEKYSQMAWSGVVSNITLQRSLLHEVFAFHPTALQISSDDRIKAPIKNIDVHDNLFANNDHRNPDGITSGLKVVNNVIYNWQQGASQGEEKAFTDWIGNYYKTGPMTDPRYDYEITFQTNTIGADPSYYVVGNVGPHNSDPGAGLDAQWSGPNRVVACYYKCPGYGDETPGQPLPDSARRDTPLPDATIPIHVELATDAYQSVLGDVGANARLACKGDWVANSDVVDQRIISEVENRTGPGTTPVTEADAGGFPSIAPGTPCADSDQDGMPDDFELRYGLDPHSAADASGDANGDGYTNLEEYLNGRSPR